MMGIRTDMSSKTGTVFSEDILKIEVYGPNQDYLTIVDVPGIFRNLTEGVTTKKDIGLVNKLVRKYIKNERTIILAVLPSNVDIATQEILSIAEEYDTMGERTLGVLTKPDLVTEYSAQLSVCSLVSGKRRPLSLGYYVVRNRGADDDNDVQQGALEESFKHEPWSTLPRERVGVAALKKQLEALLEQITRREFPHLRKDVNEKLAECQRDFDKLGPARPNEREQRGYLGGIARDFENITRGALSAQYSHTQFLRKPGRRLITQLINLTIVFSKSLKRYGQSRHFNASTPTTPDAEIEIPELKFTEAEFPIHESPRDGSSSSGSSSSSLWFRTYLRRHIQEDDEDSIDEYPELGSITAEDMEIEDPQGGIMEWIKKLYVQSRGMDLGSVNPDLLPIAFVEQSRQWENMFKVYMGEVVRLIHSFMDNALRSVCADDAVTDGLWDAISNPLLERYRSGLDQAKLLVDIERHQRPYTLNHTFNYQVQIARGERIKETLRPKAWQKTKNPDEMLMNLNDVPHAVVAKTNEEYYVGEIHDNLRSYYHLAVDRVMDNVLLQAVCYHLLTGPASPLSVFSQKWVIDLGVEQLEELGGEKKHAKKRRQILVRKRKDLEKALEILRG